MAIILTSPNCIVHQLLFTLRRVLVRPSGSSLDTTTLFIRHNSRTNNCLGNFYDTLDVPSNATQSEIKNSYYKLSMLYHPDRNKDSDKALARFREITDAYDVLCNPRTRRAYDEGLKRNVSADYRPSKEDLNTWAPPEEDDAQTRFYKNHMKRSYRSDFYDQKYYGLEEWTRQNYSKTFREQQFYISEHQRQQKSRDGDDSSVAKQMVLLSSLVLFFVYMIVRIVVGSLDDKENEKKRTS